MAQDPLILFLKEPSKQRFADLVAARREDVLNTAWRATGDPEVAEDVAQEVLLKLLDLKMDPRSVRSPRGLLVTMTVNAARSRLRGEGRRRAREIEAVRRREEAGNMESKDLTEVRKAVLDLPDGMKECVELRYFGGLPLADVAKETGLAVRTVNARLKDARDRLRERLADTAPLALLAFLAGEQEEGLPLLDPSARFLEWTDRLAAESNLLADRPPGPGAKLWVSLSACVLVVAGLWLTLGGANGDPQAPAPEETAAATVAGTKAGIPAATDEESEPAAVAQTAPEKDAAPKGGAAGEPAEAFTGFSIRVTDEEGNLLEEGTLSVDLAGFPDFDQLAKLKKWEGVLEPRPLSKANPFEVRDLPPAADGLELTASVRAPGRAPSVEVEFTIKQGVPARLTLTPPLPREMPVKVFDRFSGEPLEGAAVVSVTELRRRDIEEPDALGVTGPGSVVTEHDGTCRLGGLGDGPHDIEVHMAGYAAVRIWDTELTAEPVFRLEPIRNAAAVAVTVTDPEGQPLPGISVELDADGAGIPTVKKTDARGTCRFEPVVPGYTTINVDMGEWTDLVIERRWRKRGDPVLSRMLKLEGGAEVEVRLGYLLGASTFTAEVSDADGAPKAGVEVTVHGPQISSATSDESGRAVFEDLPEGTYRVRIGGWSYQEDVVLEEGQATSVGYAVGQASIRGTASPRAGVSVNGPASEFVRAGDDGKFEVKGVPPGVYKVQAWSKDRISAPVTVEVKGGKSPAPVTLEMVRGGRLLVTFRAPDRPAMAEAKLRLLDVRGGEHYLKTDTSGECDRLARRLLPGRYEIEVALPGGEARRISVEIAGGKDTRVEVGSP